MERCLVQWRIKHIRHTHRIPKREREVSYQCRINMHVRLMMMMMMMMMMVFAMAAKHACMGNLYLGKSRYV